MILRIAAIVIFALTAIFFFWVPDIDTRTDFGLLATGLCLWCASAFESRVLGK